MAVYQHPALVPAEKPACVTIGNFDGVHAGHLALLDEAKKICAEKHLDLVLVTFWPHPARILRGGSFPGLIITRQEKILLLEAAGVAKILEIPFTKEFAALDPESFLRDWILPLNPRHLAAGHDFCFGRNKAGDFGLLCNTGATHGFSVSRAQGLELNGKVISSSNIREFLLEGKIREATRILGRHYSLQGQVKHGFARGGKMGFPTANLQHGDTLLPANGVYATFAEYAGQAMPSITNIGTNPTFNGDKVSVETFILDEKLDLYDREIRVKFVERVRDERKFPSPAELAAQINKDILAARRILDTGT